MTFSWPAGVVGNHTFSVKTELSGDENGTKGASKQVTFTWTPNVVGQHTFEAIAELSSDSNAANDSRTTTVNISSKVEDPAETFVDRITASERGSRWYIYIYVDSTVGKVESGARAQQGKRAPSALNRQNKKG